MGSYGSRIAGFAGHRPARQVSNDDIALCADITADRIEKTTGILRRHYATSEENVIDMATVAGKQALERAGVDPAEVDLVLLATSTHRRTIPSGAPAVATRIGVPGPGAFDVNGVCAGFCYALSIASDAVRMGSARNVLVIGADKVTDWTTASNPDVYAIFADGAGAALVSRSDETAIGPPVWGSDGTRDQLLFVPDDSHHISMNGPLIYRWATANIPKAARMACDAAGIALSDVSWLVLHQANARIVDTIATALDFPADRVARDVVDTGNTSAASIPLAVSRLLESGLARSGDWTLLLGFGAGLSYAGQVVRLP